MNCLRLLRLAERQTVNIFKIPRATYGAQHPFKFMETQDRWKEKDGVSKRYELIYKGPMEKWLNYLTMYLTFTTATVSVGGVYYAAFEFDKADLDSPVILGEDLIIANSAVECLVYLGAFVGFHIAVKILLSKFVVRIYQDGDDYIAIYRGSTFNKIKKHKFHLKDFKKLNPTLVVSWGDARFDIGNKHAIILENYFKTPEHFNYLLHKKSADNPDNEDNY